MPQWRTRTAKINKTKNKQNYHSCGPLQRNPKLDISWDLLMTLSGWGQGEAVFSIFQGSWVPPCSVGWNSETYISRSHKWESRPEAGLALPPPWPSFQPLSSSVCSSHTGLFSVFPTQAKLTLARGWTGSPELPSGKLIPGPEPLCHPFQSQPLTCSRSPAHLPSFPDTLQIPCLLTGFLLIPHPTNGTESPWNPGFQHRDTALFSHVALCWTARCPSSRGDGFSYLQSSMG